MEFYELTFFRENKWFYVYYY